MITSLQDGQPLQPCSEDCHFTQQFALPYAHYISQKLKNPGFLKKEAIAAARLWLNKPLASNLLFILRFSANFEL